MNSSLQELFASPRYRQLAGEDSPVAASRGMLAFRWWGVAMLALTYLKTPYAWGPRFDRPDFPPALPLWDGWPAALQFDLYWPLLLTLALVPFVARLGLILHSVTLGYAILTDLTRIQPECFSPVILLWATLPSDNAKTIARAHLAAMWFFAGFHKLLAPAFEAFVGPEIFTRLLQLEMSPQVAHYLGLGTSIVEIAVGLGVLYAPTRRVAALAVIGMHLVIFVGSTHGIPIGCSRLWHGDWEGALAAFNPVTWYEPVWPWNLLLMWAGLAFFWNDERAAGQSRERLSWIAVASAVMLILYFAGNEIWPWNLVLVYLLVAGNWTLAETRSLLVHWQRGTLAAVCLVLLLSPFGYYLGLVNPYLANCIYTGNFIIGVRIPANTESIAAPSFDKIANNAISRDWTSLGSETSLKLGISLPPSERIYQRFFAKTGKPHERMLLYYPGWMSRFTGIRERELWLGHGEKINGVPEGLWIFYDNDGRKSSEVTFESGVQNGPAINWRPDGTKESEGSMRNNQLHGTWKFYDPGKTETAVFQDGVRVE